MTRDNRSTPDVVGKVFVVRGHGLRECLVCGELFTRCTAPQHAEVDCHLSVELLLQPTERSQ
jgi:DTW domain-containing protein YfiP